MSHLNPYVPQLQEVFASSRLDPREQHVLLRRLEGGTFAEIGADPVLACRPKESSYRRIKRGQPMSRQRVQQLEAEALRKLGAGIRSISELHADEKAGAIEHIEQRGTVEAGELHFTADDDVRAFRFRDRKRAEVLYDRAVTAFLDKPTDANRERMVALSLRR